MTSLVTFLAIMAALAIAAIAVPLVVDAVFIWVYRK